MVKKTVRRVRERRAERRACAWRDKDGGAEKRERGETRDAGSVLVCFCCCGALRARKCEDVISRTPLTLARAASRFCFLSESKERRKRLPGENRSRPKSNF
ncbi:hypothetical protein AOLI_G00214980 [Acnodon oligacanthus]